MSNAVTSGRSRAAGEPGGARKSGAPPKPGVADKPARPREATVAGCTALRFRKAARRVSQIYDACLEPYGVTITQYGLLAHIHRLDGITIGELAAELVMDPTTLTRNLGPLLERGLVTSSPGKRDRRSRSLRLTPAGRDQLAAGLAGWQQAQGQIAAVLGPDLAPLSGAIDRMLTRLSE